MSSKEKETHNDVKFELVERVMEEEQVPFLQRQLNDISTVNFWRASFAEFFGTFLLCLYTIGNGMHLPDDPHPPTLAGVALTSGFIIAVIIASLLNVSGGHVNPAISIGLLCTGHITVIRFIFYVLSQCASSVAAVLVIKALTPEEMHGTLGLLLPGAGVTPIQATIVEGIIAGVLLFGTVALIDNKRTDNHHLYPLTLFVGFIVAGNIYFAARISGGCMNPARNFGPALMNGNFALQWVYWVGGLAGGALGALTYQHVFSVDAMATTPFGLCRRQDRKKSRANGTTEADHML